MRKAVMAWQPETVKQIRPVEAGLTLEQQLENAEKTFLSEARVVSTGRGDLENLEPFLSEVKQIRRLIEDEQSEGQSGSSTKNGKVSRERRTRDLIADVVGSGDIEQARNALVALVDDVVVSEDSVTVRPRVPV